MLGYPATSNLVSNFPTLPLHSFSKLPDLVIPLNPMPFMEMAPTSIFPTLSFLQKNSFVFLSIFGQCQGFIYVREVNINLSPLMQADPVHLQHGKLLLMVMCDS